MQIGEKLAFILSKTPKAKPCEAGKHEEVIQHPTVPEAEEDPAVRVEAMEAAGVNAHEIAAARHNIADGSITHGMQLSRDLTPDEVAAGTNGDAQKIWAICRNCHAKRELDQAPDDDSQVEAKDLEKGWGSAGQRANNLKSATDGKSVTYKLPASDAAGSKGKAIYDAFRAQNVQTRVKIIGI